MIKVFIYLFIYKITFSNQQFKLFSLDHRSHFNKKVQTASHILLNPSTLPESAQHWQNRADTRRLCNFLQTQCPWPHDDYSRLYKYKPASSSPRSSTSMEQCVQDRTAAKTTHPACRRRLSICKSIKSRIPRLERRKIADNKRY